MWVYKKGLVSVKLSVAQPVWYGSADPKVTGSIPVRIVDDNTKSSDPGAWNSPAISCHSVTFPHLGIFWC